MIAIYRTETRNKIEICGASEDPRKVARLVGALNFFSLISEFELDIHPMTEIEVGLDVSLTHGRKPLFLVQRVQVDLHFHSCSYFIRFSS